MRAGSATARGGCRACPLPRLYLGGRLVLTLRRTSAGCDRTGCATNRGKRMHANGRILALCCAAVLGLCGVSMMAAGQPASTAGMSASGPPKYKYNPSWPKELPNKWTFEGITGMYVDKYDVIWVLNRPRDFDDKENAAAVVPRPANVACRHRP